MRTAINFHLREKAKKIVEEKDQKLILIVSIWLKNQTIAVFEDYERQAAKLLEAKFADYTADLETRKLAENRNEIIARTEILEGFEVSNYNE